MIFSPLSQGSCISTIYNFNSICVPPDVTCCAIFLLISRLAFTIGRLLSFIRPDSSRSLPWLITYSKLNIEGTRNIRNRRRFNPLNVDRLVKLLVAHIEGLIR